MFVLSCWTAHRMALAAPLLAALTIGWEPGYAKVVGDLDAGVVLRSPLLRVNSLQ